MQIVLVMFRSDGQRRSFSVQKDMTVIGRREDCDVRIPLGEISRKHCRLIRDENGLKVEDLGSSNGTFVNGQRIQMANLEAGDTLQIGPVAFAIQLDGVPADDEIEVRTSGKPPPTATAATASEADGQTVTNEGEFDPSAVLGTADDSGGHESLSGSEIAHDIAADLERANRSR